MKKHYTTAALTLLIAASAHAQCVTSFPSNEPFTSFTVGSAGTMANNWTNETSDDLDWLVDDNGTPTASTGPSGDHTTNNSSGIYLYTSAAGANSPNKTAIVQSPCYSIGGLTSPYVTFWYHMRGSQQGTLALDLNVNGSTISNAWTTSGDKGLYWRQGWLNLSPYIGQGNVRLRFRAVTGSGPLSDIAIDDVFVGNLTPVFGCNETTASNYSASVNVNNGTCNYSCGAGLSRVRVDIVADRYPSEISWTLKNGSTNVTLASGTTQGTSICVPASTCLIFRINDSYGDGICCGYGNGLYRVSLNGTTIQEGGNYGSFDEVIFNCPPGFNCGSPLPLTLAPVGTTFPVTLATVTAPSVEAWYDFTPPQTGSYTITTCGTNSCDTRLWLYDMNCNQLVLSSGIEGATFGDDNEGGCGLQAVVNANMPAGVVHHMRIGDNAGACGGSVTFRIIYNGPVVGCMNNQSCNFEPLATVPCNNCCIAFGDPTCPDGPDLTMSSSALASSLSLATVNITDACAPVEGCTRGMGSRQVLRFTTRIENIGTTDYYIGSPSTQPQMFSTANCHGHSHYQGYADYILFDQVGNAIPVGFKNGFCVIDVGCNPSFTGQFGCSNMGISKGCYDIYGSGTTCNWIDITEVPAGTYTLVLRTNWQHRPDALGRPERDYSNNFAQVCINLTRDVNNVPSFSIVTSCAPYVDCLGQPYGDARYDCTGVCGGPVKRGDLNNDFVQSPPDAMTYVSSIIGNDIAPSPCNDLNGDNAITVTDAALMVNCYTQRDIHNAGGVGIDYHPWCEFPRGYLSTPDTVSLSLANLDPVNKTVDVYIRNPSCLVLGYEFNMGGLTIQSATNLAPNLVNDISISTALGDTKVIGLSYVDTSLIRNTSPVPLVRINYLSLTGPSVCISSINDIVNKDANNVITRITGGCLNVPNTVGLSPKVWLDGAYESGTGLMRDDLRVASRIPTTEPYTALGFTQIGGGGEQVANSVLNVSGNNAIVDWVLLELHATTAPYALLATRCALLQRDGDIVATDGIGPVLMQMPPGNYHVSVRHRNHFGIMTSTPIGLGSTSTTIDFRSSTTVTWGTNARKDIAGAMAMWAGNAKVDRTILYTGENNDRDPILSIIGGVIPTGMATGYYLEDVNLTGEVKYTGEDNDRDIILFNIGGVIPTNTITEQMP